MTSTHDTNPSASNNSFNTPTDNKDWHTVGRKQVIELLKSDTDRGLTNDEVVHKRNYFGKNELKQTGGRSKLSILWDQFTNV
ncbi:MAG: cation-transporting P-type ATPase, partial [Cyanobacteria bacterium J06635_13]